ncbi:hypothetical protein EJB05_44574 [Eragrostis curvula]|uniref:Uncharacterized protein n=1 Tax=Eragrostis curvula TaxID=38414 RepID=A0A5J9TIA1_9POAL|nr:hypothetical protein EJB05_44574 [Eragrostis curvula]
MLVAAQMLDPVLGTEGSVGRGLVCSTTDLGLATMMASVEGNGELTHMKGRREVLVLVAL